MVDLLLFVCIAAYMEVAKLCSDFFLPLPVPEVAIGWDILAFDFFSLDLRTVDWMFSKPGVIGEILPIRRYSHSVWILVVIQGRS